VFELTGNVALVTGGGQGIALKVLEALKECGADVIVNDIDGGRAVAAAKRFGGRAAPFDVADIFAVRAATGVSETYRRRVQPIERWGTGRDIGAAIVWLTAEGGWVTGQTIAVDGGVVMIR
jgi:NAD(P)-dependent dehydrogenase (short-subunit alcohol dehydrogenase family)